MINVKDYEKLLRGGCGECISCGKVVVSRVDGKWICWECEKIGDEMVYGEGVWKEKVKNGRKDDE